MAFLVSLLNCMLCHWIVVFNGVSAELHPVPWTVGAYEI
jgi:hypothetical protein